MNTPILADIFQRALSLELNVQRDNAKQQKTAYTLWAEMAESLEVIAANSAKGGRIGGNLSGGKAGNNQVVAPSEKNTGGVSRSGTPAHTDRERNSGKRTAGGAVSSGTADSQSSSNGLKGKTDTASINRGAGSGTQKKGRRRDKSIGTGKTPVVKKEESKQSKEARQTVPATSTKTGKGNSLANAIKQAGNKQASSISNTLANQEEQNRKKTKSAEALQNVKEQKREDKRQNGFFSRIKNAFEDTKNSNRTGDVVDAAGMAAGGPVWAVAKELKQAGSSLVGEDSFLGKFWANFKENGEQEPGRAGKQVEAKNGGPTRDEHGRFIKASERDRTRREREQLEISAESFDLDTKEAVRDQRRHKELVRAVRSLKPSFLGDALKGLLGRRGPSVSLGGKGKVRPDIDVHKDKKDKRKRGRGGVTIDADSRDRRRSRRLGGGSSLGRGRLPGGAGAGLGGTIPATGRGGALGGAGRTAGKLGGKMALLNMGKLIPGIGLAIGAIAAVVDAVDGWNDTDLHKRAFGLKDGQEATTGQKAASAAANILDLGGLTTGVANLLGFDIDTADMARGIYNTVSAVSDFFKQFSLDGALSAVKGVLDSGLTLASDAVSGIADFASSLNLGERLQGLVSTVAEYGGKAVDFVVNAFTAIPSLLTGIDFSDKIKNVVSAVSDTVSNVFSAISDFISSFDIKGAIAGAVDVVTEAGGKVIDKGHELFTGAKNWLFGEDKEDKKTSVPAKEAVPTTPALPDKAKLTPEKPKKEKPAGGGSVSPIPVATATNSQTATQASQPELPAPSFAEPVAVKPQAQPVQSPVVPALSASDRANMAQSVSASMPELGDLTDKTGQLVKISEEELKLREKEFNLRLADPNTQAVLAQGGPGGSPLMVAGGGSSFGGSAGGGPVDFSGAVATGGFSPSGKIGDTVARFESGNAGVSDVSWDKTGGSSYGKWQLSAKQGSMGEYLKWMQKKGGKEAEIANSILGAGPLENGKNGAAATEYKRQASMNGQLLEETQRQFILEKQVNPALRSLPPELQQRINNSGAMKEMFWSTVVQHGQGGGASIFKNIYNQNRNASDEDLIKAIYADRGNHFQSSTAETQASVRRRFKEEVGVILGMYQNEKKGGGAPANGSGVILPASGGAVGGSMDGGYTPIQSSIPAGTAGPLPVNAALENQMSAGISNLTLDASNRNVRYELGAKNSRNGTIDCSGWVYEQTSNLMNGINQAAGKEVFSSAAKKALKQGADNQGAAGIVQSVANYTGKLYQGEELDPSRIGGGMVIGIDTGKHSWDGGRFQGIDHIAQTYRDPKTGQLMVSESSSSKGVHSQTYESWYNYYVKKKGARIFGGNVAAMANPGTLPQTDGQAVAANTAPVESAPVVAEPVPAMAAQPAAQPMPVAQAQPVQAQPVVQQYSPEPVGSIAPPTMAGTNNQLGTGNIEKLLKDILFVLRAGFGHMPLGTAGIGGAGGVQNNQGQQVPNIQMDFDDPAARDLATS